MLELVNLSRADPVGEAARLGLDLNNGLAPGTISAMPKQPLAFHPLLLEASRRHSDDMLARNFFDHANLDGLSPSDRAAAVGYAASVGENIAYNSSSGTLDLVASVRTNHEGLFRSTDHRPNLLDGAYSVVGLGLRTGRFRGQNALMVTQKFSSGVATDDAGPFIVGVAYRDGNGNGRYDPGEGLPGIRVQPSIGSYFAVTTSSGGYAIPMLAEGAPLQEDVLLPFASTSEVWSRARPYDEDFRARKIREAPARTVVLTWSGGALSGPVQTVVEVKRPTRIEYRLMGTSGTFFPRTMITAASAQADLVLAGKANAASAGLVSSAGQPVWSGPSEPPRPQVLTPQKVRGHVYRLRAIVEADALIAGAQYRLRAPGRKKFGQWVSEPLSPRTDARVWSTEVRLRRAGAWRVQIRTISHNEVPSKIRATTLRRR